MKKILAVLLVLLTVSAFASAQSYKDGVYKGTYDAFDNHGWKPFIEVTIKGGKISAVVFDYLNPAGLLKTKDPAYNKRMLDVGKKTNPEKAYPELVAALVKKGAAPVDAVSGATSSSGNFNELAKAVLEKAKKGDKTDTVLFMDGVYTAQDVADERGYIGVLEVEYKGGKIVKVTYNEYKDVKTKAEPKRGNADLDKNMKAKSGIAWNEALAKIEAAAVAKGGAVDVVTGATGMSTRFNALMAAIVKQRTGK